MVDSGPPSDVTQAIVRAQIAARKAAEPRSLLPDVESVPEASSDAKSEEEPKDPVLVELETLPDEDLDALRKDFGLSNVPGEPRHDLLLRLLQRHRRGP